jgi:hypothetical protein
MSAFAVSACGEASSLASGAATISTRRPPTPGFGETLTLDPDSVRVAGLTTAGQPAFLTYDGYDAQLCRLTPVDSGWTLTCELTHVHT